jgi:hypothetical protein
MSAAMDTLPQALRIAQYSVYPRAASGHAVLTGFTRDIEGGAPARQLHLLTSAPESVGELLRVRIQDLNERDTAETLARVVACDPRGDGRFQLTLEALDDAHRPRFVRTSRP